MVGVARIVCEVQLVGTVGIVGKGTVGVVTV